MANNVDIWIVYCYDDAYGCYIDGKLEERNNGICHADRVLELLVGKTVNSFNTLRFDFDDLDEDPYWDYPDNFEEVVTFAKSIGQWIEQ